MAQAPVERPVQVAQNPMVPLRRPGDSGSGSSGAPAAITGPSPIGGPSSPVAPGTYGGPAYGGPGVADDTASAVAAGRTIIVVW